MAALNRQCSIEVRNILKYRGKNKIKGHCENAAGQTYDS